MRHRHGRLQYEYSPPCLVASPSDCIGFDLVFCSFFCEPFWNLYPIDHVLGHRLTSMHVRVRRNYLSTDNVQPSFFSIEHKRKLKFIIILVRTQASRRSHDGVTEYWGKGKRTCCSLGKRPFIVFMRKIGDLTSRSWSICRCRTFAP